MDDDGEDGDALDDWDSPYQSLSTRSSRSTSTSATTSAFQPGDHLHQPRVNHGSIVIRTMSPSPPPPLPSFSSSTTTATTSSSDARARFQSHSRQTSSNSTIIHDDNDNIADSEDSYHHHNDPLFNGGLNDNGEESYNDTVPEWNWDSIGDSQPASASGSSVQPRSHGTPSPRLHVDDAKTSVSGQEQQLGDDNEEEEKEEEEEEGGGSLWSPMKASPDGQTTTTTTPAPTSTSTGSIRATEPLRHDTTATVTMATQRQKQQQELEKQIEATELELHQTRQTLRAAQLEYETRSIHDTETIRSLREQLTRAHEAHETLQLSYEAYKQRALQVLQNQQQQQHQPSTESSSGNHSAKKRTNKKKKSAVIKSEHDHGEQEQHSDDVVGGDDESKSEATGHKDGEKGLIDDDRDDADDFDDSHDDNDDDDDEVVRIAADRDQLRQAVLQLDAVCEQLRKDLVTARENAHNASDQLHSQLSAQNDQLIQLKSHTAQLSLELERQTQVARQAGEVHVSLRSQLAQAQQLITSRDASIARLKSQLSAKMSAPVAAEPSAQRYAVLEAKYKRLADELIARQTQLDTLLQQTDGGHQHHHQPIPSSYIDSNGHIKVLNKSLVRSDTSPHFTDLDTHLLTLPTQRRALPGSPGDISITFPSSGGTRGPTSSPPSSLSNASSFFSALQPWNQYLRPIIQPIFPSQPVFRALLLLYIIVLQLGMFIFVLRQSPNKISSPPT
jgi:hypothetical protein